MLIDGRAKMICGMRYNYNDLKDKFDTILDNIKMREDENARLSKENSYLRSENYKDNELSKMKEELESITKRFRRSFEVTSEDWEKIRAWQKKHDTEEHKNPGQYHGTCGGGYSFEFYPTGIGTFGSCVCGICKSRALKSSDYSKYLKDHDGQFDFDDI